MQPTGTLIAAPVAMSLCPNCRRLDADPGSIHNRGRLVSLDNRRVGSLPEEARLYACRHCGALWHLTFSPRSPRLPLPAERWQLREAGTLHQAA